MSVSAWGHKKPDHRLPLKTTPVRVPGQSGDERIDELRDEFSDDLTVTVCVVLLALLEWIHWSLDLPPRPIPVTILALAAIGYVWKKGMPLKLVLRNLRLGRDGERLVAECLDPIRAKGYRVFHDIPGNGFNIDHVIVGPAGVFAIETKTRSKSPQGGATLVYDGKSLRFENGQPFNEPLNQSIAQARWLAELLNDGRVQPLLVRPVVVFPEWYVQRAGSRTKDEVWVLNPKALAKFLEYEPTTLSASLIDSVAHTLTCYCRQSENQRKN